MMIACNLVIRETKKKRCNSCDGASHKRNRVCLVTFFETVLWFRGPHIRPKKAPRMGDNDHPVARVSGEASNEQPLTVLKHHQDNTQERDIHTTRTEHMACDA